jgi:hypothetical protein
MGRADHRRRVEAVKNEIDRRAKVWVDALVAVMRPVRLAGPGEAEEKCDKPKTGAKR